MTPGRLLEIRELLERATSGTQEIRHSYQIGTYREPKPDEAGAVWQPVANCSKSYNARFFAQAHTIITELLEELDYPP